MRSDIKRAQCRAGHSVSSHYTLGRIESSFSQAVGREVNSLLGSRMAPWLEGEL